MFRDHFGPLQRLLSTHILLVAWSPSTSRASRA